MVFVTAACFVVWQHRRGIARREATTSQMGQVDSQSEHGNISHPAYEGSERAERENVDPGVVPSEETRMQQLPPAYIPGEAALGRGETVGFLVSMDHPFNFSRTETIPNRNRGSVYFSVGWE